MGTGMPNMDRQPDKITSGSKGSVQDVDKMSIHQMSGRPTQRFWK